MNETLHKEIEAVKAETPTGVRPDPGSLLYGSLFVFLGYWLLDLGATAFGGALMALGAFGVLTGLATFVSRSPRVKVLQALDSFALALCLLAFLATGAEGDGLFENPLVLLAAAAFMVWAGSDDLREFGVLRRAELARRQARRP